MKVQLLYSKIIPKDSDYMDINDIPSLDDNAFSGLCGIKGKMSISNIIFFNWANQEGNDEKLNELQLKDPVLSFDCRHGSFRTSHYHKIIRMEVSYLCFDYIIFTRNSIYVFREGEYSERPKMSDFERLQLMSYML